MRKIKNLLIPKKTPKYSDKYYRKILLRSSLLIVLLSSVLLLFFIGKTINNRIDEANEQLNSENKFCFSTINEVFTNAKLIFGV